jgi:hypothetical protein
VVSAVPIAIIANVVRITSTGMLYAWHYDRFAELVFHDLAGWLMMPLALGLLWLETQFLSRVIVEELVEPHVSPLAALAGVQPRGTKNREPSVAVGAK